jgi:hypothetical protein
MIKANKGIVELKGNISVLKGELGSIIRYIYNAELEEHGEEQAKEEMKFIFEKSLLRREELEKEVGIETIARAIADIVNTMKG